jgi:ABC-type tungstate transport system substrate-binding protein
MGNSRIEVPRYSIGGAKLPSKLFLYYNSFHEFRGSRALKSLIDKQRAVPPCVLYMVIIIVLAMQALIHVDGLPHALHQSPEVLHLSSA